MVNVTFSLVQLTNRDEMNVPIFLRSKLMSVITNKAAVQCHLSQEIKHVTLSLKKKSHDVDDDDITGIYDRAKSQGQTCASSSMAFAKSQPWGEATERHIGVSQLHQFHLISTFAPGMHKAPRDE